MGSWCQRQVGEWKREEPVYPLGDFRPAWTLCHTSGCRRIALGGHLWQRSAVYLGQRGLGAARQRAAKAAHSCGSGQFALGWQAGGPGILREELHSW